MFLKGGAARFFPLAGVTIVMGMIPGCAKAQSGDAALPGDPRTRVRINSEWLYRNDGFNLAERPSAPDSDWQVVSLPHTWNVTDPFDDLPGYRRGVSWYRKHIDLPSALKGKKVFLHFEGVNQVADVFVNGAFVGEHKGGYTAFSVDVTKELHFDGAGNSNTLAVQVNNSHNPFLPPLSVGYALYGGIYRDVWLVATNEVHLATTDIGPSGVYVSTPGLTNESGVVRVRGSVSNESGAARNLVIINTVRNANGNIVAERSTSLAVGAGASAGWDHTLSEISNPRLWSPDDPYLYSVRTEVRDGVRLLDRVNSPLGFRWYGFDAQNGFSLNGKKFPVRGTNRHQDYQGLGSALADSLHRRDLRWIKDMGANFVRLAHYPQDPAVLAAADTLGLMIWEEIPVVNYITAQDEFTANSTTMLREMIRQHFNHPSVIVWGIMNEVFLWSPQGFRIRKQADSLYMGKVRALASLLDSVAHAEDRTRPTAMAVHGSDDYDTSGVAGVTDILGQNIYSGWYSGVFDDFGKQLDRRHAAHPSERLFVSEYGAEDDARVNSLEPERFDFSGSWMRRFHESYLRQISSRPWLAGTAVWSQFDFSQPETGGSIPYMNQKGLQTWDRKPKDAYYLYKANWNPEPMVYIASRGWARRQGVAAPQPLDVYSNLPAVELFVNGASLGTKTPDAVHRATWDVPFVNGTNRIVTRGVGTARAVSDQMEIHFALRPSRLNDPDSVVTGQAVNVGSKAQYAQPGGSIWEGDKAYGVGSFGHTDGEAKMFDKDVAIKGSSDTPVFFTYISGLTAYRFDLPDGEYLAELLFAEPDAKPGDRIFSVSANGQMLLNKVDLAAQYGIAQAVTIKRLVDARGGSGIVLTFEASKGKPILNGIRLSTNTK